MSSLNSIIKSNRGDISEFRQRLLSNTTKKVFGAVCIYDDKEDDYETKLAYLSINKNDNPNASKVYAYGVITPDGYKLKEVDPGVYLIVKDDEK